jgi:hypothetical protein
MKQTELMQHTISHDSLKIDEAIRLYKAGQTKEAIETLKQFCNQDCVTAPGEKDCECCGIDKAMFYLAQAQ